MAKASKEDIKTLQVFFESLEKMLNSEGIGGKTRHYTDEEIGNYVLNAVKYGSVGTDWRRVVWGCDLLIDNCCDPNKTYLDFKPELKAPMPETPSSQPETELD